MGNAYAGAAVAAEDASTAYANPAGMTYLDNAQIVNVAHFILGNGRFSNNGSINASARPLGNTSSDISENKFLYNLYYANKLNNRFSVGLSINSPFGSNVEYDKKWLGRFQSVKSKLKTVNINPAIAYKLNDAVSIGFGLSAMWAQTQSENAINLGVAESTISTKSKDWGFGYNLGAIINVSQNTRIGLAYRSKVNQILSGKLSSPFTALDANPYQTLNTDIEIATVLPDSLTINGLYQANNKLTLLAGVTWTGWAQVKQFKAVRTNGSNSSIDLKPQNWDNTLRYSLGASYQLNDRFKLRTGFAYDEEVSSLANRSVATPGNDRLWLSLGASFKYSQTVQFDVGYAHLFIRDARIDNDQTKLTSRSPLNNGRVTGAYDLSADLLSMQMVVNF